MGIFSSLFGIFKKKAAEIPVEVPEESPLSAFDVPQETMTMDNFKAKMDLITTHFDTLKTQYEVLNEKVSAIERMVKELYEMSKR